MDVSEYASHDAAGLAELIRSGQVSAAEVEEAARRAIEAVNPAVNGLVGPLFDESLAYDPAGPLAGVPFLLKDLVCHAAGVSHEFGSRLCSGWRFPEDTHLAARFRSAGLATLGRAATPEFGLNVNTEPVVNGSTRNPWDTGRTAGGSSGGSAALVAAGAVPAAHANDAGGSIRIPASCCGLVGLKPSRGRVSPAPDAAEPVLGFAAELAVTRTVRDTALLLDLVEGPAVGDKYEIRRPDRPYAEEIGLPPGRLRVAVQTAAPSGAPVDPACAGAAERIGRELEALGHEVTLEAPALDPDAYLQMLEVVWAAGTAGWVTAIGAVTGREPSADNLEAATWATVELGRSLTAVDLLGAEAACNAVSRTVGAFFERYDVLVSPTLATLPLPLGTLDQNDPGRSAQEWLRLIFGSVAPFPTVFNVTGGPAISLPLCESADGLPVGIQVATRFGGEATLLRLAAQLEEAVPWRQRRPAVYAS